MDPAFRQRVEAPVETPPLEVGGVLLPTLGWVGHELTFVFTPEPNESGYHVGRLRRVDGKRVGSSWIRTTRQEAEEDAARVYWTQDVGWMRESYTALEGSVDRRTYWSHRKYGLGGGWVPQQVDLLLEEIADVGPHEYSINPAGTTIELLAGPGLRMHLQGSGRNLNEAIGDLLAKVEALAGPRATPPG